MNINIDGYNIFYKDEGNFENVIVILQGWGTELGIYDSIANCLNKHYRVIRLDLPGFGQSDEPKEPWSVDDYVDFFLKFLQSINVTAATLIGHSYGGRMIIKLASRNQPSINIEKIILIGSAGIVHKKTFKQKFKIRMFKTIKRFLSLKPIYTLFPEHIEKWRNSQGSPDYRNASPIMRQCLVKAVNENLTDLLKRIDKETLLIWGENDVDTPITDARLMEKEIPNAGLAVIKNAGHYCFLEQPIVFEKILKSYFNIGG